MLSAKLPSDELSLRGAANSDFATDLDHANMILVWIILEFVACKSEVAA